MRRGDILTIAISGDYGKPRPAVVIQAVALGDTDSILICQVTTTHRDAPLYRLMIPVTSETGLRAVSYVMADKIFAVRREKCGPVIGRLPDEVIPGLDEMLAVVIGLAD
jgi:mRNA interferase MazF